MGDCLRTTGAAGTVLDRLDKKSQIKKFDLHDSCHLPLFYIHKLHILYPSSHQIVQLGFFPNSYAAAVYFELTSVQLHRTGTFEGLSTD